MTKIDLMIASHGHADHINGLKSVIEKVRVEKLAIADADDPGLWNLYARHVKRRFLLKGLMKGFA